MSATVIPEDQESNIPHPSQLIAGIVSGVSITVLFILFGIFIIYKERRKKTHDSILKSTGEEGLEENKGRSKCKANILLIYI